MEASSYNDIGHLLRQARQEMRLELEEVSHVLHIRQRYLKALESGRLADLPGVSYTKGYLQVYATYVGLDKDEILRRFEEVEHQLGRRGFYFPQVLRKDKTPNPAIAWGGLAAAVVLYMFWLAVLQPSRSDISIVEPFPVKKGETMPFSLINADEGACLGSRPVLYPACTMVQQGASLTQLRSQIYPVEGLANYTSGL